MHTVAVLLQGENNPDAALDMLMDPEASEALQLSILERQEQRDQRRKRARDARDAVGRHDEGHEQAGSTSALEPSASPAAAAAEDAAGPSGATSSSGVEVSIAQKLLVHSLCFIGAPLPPPPQFNCGSCSL